jgi:hypothetical protein
LSSTEPALRRAEVCARCRGKAGRHSLTVADRLPHRPQVWEVLSHGGRNPLLAAGKH